MSQWNIAAKPKDEQDKVNVDLAASGVVYKERPNMPVIAEQVAREQPEHLREYFLDRVRYYCEQRLHLPRASDPRYQEMAEQNAKNNTRRGGHPRTKTYAAPIYIVVLDGVDPPSEELIRASMVAVWLASIYPSHPLVSDQPKLTPFGITAPSAFALATEFPLKKSSCLAFDLPPGARASSNGTIILRRYDTALTLKTRPLSIQ